METVYRGYSISRRQYMETVYEGDSVWRRQCMEETLYEGDSIWRRQYMEETVYGGDSVWKRQCMEVTVPPGGRAKPSGHNDQRNCIMSLSQHGVLIGPAGQCQIDSSMVNVHHFWSTCAYISERMLHPVGCDTECATQAD